MGTRLTRLWWDVWLVADVVWAYISNPLKRELIQLCTLGVGKASEYEHGCHVDFVAMRDAEGWYGGGSSRPTDADGEDLRGA